MAVADPDKTLLGEALKQLRLRKGMTQEELLAATGIHTTYISDIERGARNPSRKTLVRLADGLGLRVAELGAEFDALRH